MSVGRSLFFAVLLYPGVLLAHHNVEETIKELTAQIANAPSAELYFKRAIEYRALRKPTNCAADLRAALRLSPHHHSSKMALARLLMSLGKYDESRTLSAELIEVAKTPGRKIEALFLSAELAHASEEDEKALQILNQLQKGFPVHDESIDLFHGYLLIRNDKAPQAARMLQQSYQRTKGVVLRNSWIDASLVAGEIEEVWPIIKRELEESRFKAAWLIRRARVAQLQGQDDQMRKDLQLASKELEGRIKPGRPDLTLVSDRGLARAMLGEKTKAKDDLNLLRKSGFPPPSYVYLEELLKD